MSDIDQNAASGSQPPATSPAPAPARRRFFQNRWFIASTIIATGFIGFGLGKITNHTRWSGHHGMSRMVQTGEMTRGADFMLNRVLNKVDATQSQKDKIGEITRTTISELAPLRQQHFATRTKLAELMKADKLDRAAVEQLRTQELALAETLSKRAAQALLDAADILTPAQRITLVERMQKRRGGGWYNRG
jgi:periplasmic protein CpxP/Spy